MDFNLENEIGIWRKQWEDTCTAAGMPLGVAKKWVADREHFLWLLTTPGRVKAHSILRDYIPKPLWFWGC